MKKYFIFLPSLALLSGLYCAEVIAADVMASEKQASSITRRIEVYSISQNFWDVKSGESLGEIIKKLLPDNPSRHKSLLLKIVQLNPEAFSGGDPNKLKANTRLWLPNSVPRSLHKTYRHKYHIRSFSWGQAYKIKRD